MNNVLKLLFDRKSVRVYENKDISKEDVDQILMAAIQAPTAGNQQFYTILKIEDQKLKEQLALLCDHQPFIAQGKLVLVFLADCRKWLNAYQYAKTEYRKPSVGDLLLACEDAVIAAQNSVIAAESLGIGSCYIGDILENKEEISKLLCLKEYVVPISMVVYGYPTKQQKERIKPKRFSEKYVIMKDTYRELTEEETRNMMNEKDEGKTQTYEEYVNAFCKRKYMSEFSRELNRSVKEYIKEF